MTLYSQCWNVREVCFEKKARTVPQLWYQTELEQTATLLDQVALRRFIYAHRVAAQSSVIPYGASSHYDMGSYQDTYAFRKG